MATMNASSIVSRATTTASGSSARVVEQRVRVRLQPRHLAVGRVGRARAPLRSVSRHALVAIRYSQARSDARAA